MTQKNRAGEVEKWNENVETCSDCGIQWKKIGKTCPVCFAPPENPNNTLTRGGEE